MHQKTITFTDSLENLTSPIYFEYLQDSELCVALAFSLQYIRLTVFCWLSAMTHDMYTTFR
jgi:hypothetical protein